MNGWLVVAIAAATLLTGAGVGFFRGYVTGYDDAKRDIIKMHSCEDECVRGHVDD